MTLHAWARLVKHRLQAKRLHGVHSPFVFRFGQVVLNARRPTKAANDTTRWMAPQYQALVASIREHYALNAPAVLEADGIELPEPTNFLILKDDKPGDWVRLFNKYNKDPMPETVFIFYGIHKTKRHTHKWQRLCAYPMAMACLDLYGMGIIWFREEFLEKQLFVLK